MRRVPPDRRFPEHPARARRRSRQLTHLYRSPDIKTIGISLDVPKGLVVKDATGAVAAAGMKPGDRIAAWNGVPVWTFGDVQYRYDKVDRRAKGLEITVDRSGQPVDLTVELPPRWWWTDLRFRQSSVDPRLDFEDRPLTGDEKQKLGLKPDGFASQVKYVSEFAKIRGHARPPHGRRYHRGRRRGARRVRQHRGTLPQAAHQGR